MIPACPLVDSFANNQYKLQESSHQYEKLFKSKENKENSRHNEWEDKTEFIALNKRVTLAE